MSFGLGLGLTLKQGCVVREQFVSFSCGRASGLLRLSRGNRNYLLISRLCLRSKSVWIIFSSGRNLSASKPDKMYLSRIEGNCTFEIIF